MYDIDPPTPILHLDAPRKARGLYRSLAAEQKAAVTGYAGCINSGEGIGYDALRKASQPTALTDRQHLARIAQADPIAVRHSVGAAILRLNTLARADGSLAQRIDQL